MRNLILAVFAILIASPIVHAQQRPAGVLCSPSTWVPSDEPPMTGWCQWVPNRYGSWVNVSVCDPRQPTPPIGSVDITDQPLTFNAATGTYSVTPGANCARINDSAGGYFDWIAFQYFGWANQPPTYSPIRGLIIAPGTGIVAGSKAYNNSAPDHCDSSGTCFGVTSFSSLPSYVPDVWATFPAMRMASIWVHRP